MIYYINNAPAETKLFYITSVFKQNSGFYNFNQRKSNFLLKMLGSIPSEDYIDKFSMSQNLFCAISAFLPSDSTTESGDDDVIEIEDNDFIEIDPEELMDLI
jgi:hypothetical protein